VDRYLEFVAGRCRPNTLRAVAFDLKALFAVTGKDPVQITAADVFEFLAQLPGEYSSSPLTVDIFAVNLLLAVVATRVMFVLVRRWGLLGGEIDARDEWALRVRAVAIVMVVALSVGLAWVNTTAAKYCWVLIPSCNRP
jgi:hypothetical protein